MNAIDNKVYELNRENPSSVSVNNVPLQCLQRPTCCFGPTSLAYIDIQKRYNYRTSNVTSIDTKISRLREVLLAMDDLEAEYDGMGHIHDYLKYCGSRLDPHSVRPRLSYLPDV